eukprot:NODE_4859_length_622_cov_34.417103_g4183_i0.p2 GENE.NODE_4859_length_622_cov_34.417103_g4183_i0~~NODE_4859_length_622_cov_34.417103_g4183_i0.p2  ORF type:complete len:152 (+),score=29.56 NODE_4859_length_622_cov_34.417103_g4183_i0:49-456(+)
MPRNPGPSMHTTGHAFHTNADHKFLKQVYNSERRLHARSQARGGSPPKVDSLQRPVEESEREPLYVGIGREGEGRIGYLKTQASKSPQQRFRAPLTSSHAIGWDASATINDKSPHARKQVVKDSFERTRGVFIFD